MPSNNPNKSENKKTKLETQNYFEIRSTTLYNFKAKEYPNGTTLI